MITHQDGQKITGEFPAFQNYEIHWNPKILGWMSSDPPALDTTRADWVSSTASTKSTEIWKGKTANAETVGQKSHVQWKNDHFEWKK